MRRNVFLMLQSTKPKPMATMQIRMKPETIADLKKEASKSSRTPVFIIRELVELWVKEQRKKGMR